VSYPTAGTASVAATIDDVNGDKIPDLIVASNDQHISVLIGKGDGSFGAATSFAAPLPGSTTPSNTPILALITADLRGIGKKDIICSNGLVLLGNGNGTFTSLATPAFPFVPSPASGVPPGVASGDLNNDGKIDLVVGSGAMIYTWLGKGDGTFTAGNAYTSIVNYGSVAVTDLDGDGNADIYSGMATDGFYSGDFSNPAAGYVLLGNGDDTFQGAPVLSSGAYSGNNLADVNGDGVPDIVSNTFASVSGTSATFTVALNDGKGLFTPVSTITAPDTFTLNGYTFTGVSKAGASSYAVADVNGDDKADLLFVDNGLTATNAGSSSAITYPYPVYFVALGNGDGTFQAPVPHAFPQIAPPADFDNSLTVAGLQIADFNRDGHADLIFNYNDIAGGTGVMPYLQGLGVLTGAGNGTFSTTPILTSTYSSATAPTTALLPQIVNVADLNGDSNPDLIVNAPGTTVVNFQLQSQLQVYLSKGDGTFKSPTTIPIGSNAYGLPVLADFNKDGKLDLAVLAESSPGQAELAVSLGNGDGAFAAAAISNLDGGDAIRGSGLAGADFDDDGNIDLALIDSADFSGVFYGKGDGTFTSVPLNGNIVPKDLINISSSGPAVAVDLNKDGKPDILAGNVSLLNIYGAAPLATGAAATATTLSASAATIAAGSSVTFTAQVTPSGSGTPTGTVTFLNGTTSLGAGTLDSGGTATFSTSSLAAGSYSVTAAYGGDATFAPSTSSAVALTVTGAGATPDFTLAASAATLTIAAGKSGTETITVTPKNGFNQATAFACSGLPSGAACSFSPASVTPSGTAASSTTLTITTTAASSRNLNPWPFAGGGIAFAFGVFFVRGRKRLPNLLGLMLLLLSIGGIASGCGGSSSKTSGTPAGTTTVTVTATSGTGATALSHMTTLSLTIQ
jgi:hypothetical protein